VGQITAHSNPHSSFSLSFFPLCVRRGLDEKILHLAVQYTPPIGPRAVHSAPCGLSLLLQPPAYPLILPEDVARAQACPHQGEPLVRLLLYWDRHPLRVVPADDHVHWPRPLANRHARPGDLRERLPGALGPPLTLSPSFTATECSLMVSNITLMKMSSLVLPVFTYCTHVQPGSLRTRRPFSFPCHCPLTGQPPRPPISCSLFHPALRYLAILQASFASSRKSGPLSAGSAGRRLSARTIASAPIATRIPISPSFFFFILVPCPALFLFIFVISLTIHTLFFLGMFSCWVFFLPALGK
jgi:hypothetical protein